MSSNDLIAKLTDWVKTQGYPLEMEVAHTFQKAGMRASLADFYIDEDTGKPREIDVTASQWSSHEESVYMNVSCRMECKSAQDKPWMVFVSKAQPERLIPPLHVISSSAYHPYIFEVVKHDSFRNHFNQLELFACKHLGHGVTQAFTTGHDVPYQAVIGTIKASLDLTTTFNTLLKPSKANPRRPYMCCVAFPAVVIDGKLFECSVDNDEVAISEVEASTLLWKGTPPNMARPYVHIVTKPYLPSFASRVKQAADAFISATMAHQKELCEIGSCITS